MSPELAPQTREISGLPKDGHGLCDMVENAADRQRGENAVHAPACFSLHWHQRSRILHVSLDGIRGPIGERANRAGRVLASVLGKSACAGDENVRHIPIVLGSVPSTAPPVL